MPVVAEQHPSAGVVATPARDGGYSLIEILTAIMIASVLMAFGVGSFKSWALAKDQQGAAATVQTMLRQTQTRAITEGVSFCVAFDTTGTQYTINRYACDTPTQQVNGPFSMPSQVSMKNFTFKKADGTLTRAVTFKPTGTATAGALQVVRVGSSKVYTISIEGFTGRVSTS